jgi:hypothetical protein
MWAEKTEKGGLLFVLHHALKREIKSRLMNFTGHSNCRTKE